MGAFQLSSAFDGQFACLKGANSRCDEQSFANEVLRG